MEIQGRPFLSLLIVNYNGKHHLTECLDSIGSQTFRDFEIVIVDNHSQDGSREFLCDRYPTVKCLHSPTNLGFAGGNNFGIPECRGEWVFCLNNDTRLDPEALANWAASVRDFPDIGVFAAMLLRYHETALIDSAGDTLYLAGPTFSFSGFPANLFSRPREITSACAGAVFFKRELLNRLGGFDSTFFLNLEDVDLSLRARHLGESIVFLPSVKIFHKGSATLGGKKSRLSLYYSERNWILLIIKNLPWLPLVAYLPGFLFLKLGRLVVMGRAGMARTYFQANWHGLILLPQTWAKRKEIIASSTLTSAQVLAWFRLGWIRDRLALRRGRFEAIRNSIQDEEERFARRHATKRDSSCGSI